MKKEISLEEFQETLPFHFSDLELLQKVFVHRSYLNEKGASALRSKESYERLEFLGDAVLSSIVSHLLYENYPETTEGELTRLRAKLVNRQTLAGIALELRLNEYVLLGKGERSAGGAENPTILAGVFEALVAAVYTEFGFKIAFSYIDGLFTPLMDSATAHEPGHFDFKPRLQELAQRLFKVAPVYRLVSEKGPPHKRTFEVEVTVKGEVLATGSASKKKDAEQLAAEKALERLVESGKEKE